MEGRTTAENEFTSKDPEWIATQKAIFSRWLNVMLRKRTNSSRVTTGPTLLADLADGVVLLQVMQVLYPAIHLPRWFDPAPLEVQRIDNCTTLLRAVELAGIHLEFCTPRNIVERDEQPVMGLIWLMLKEFEIKEAVQKSKILDELVQSDVAAHAQVSAAVSPAVVAPAPAVEAAPAAPAAAVAAAPTPAAAALANPPAKPGVGPHQVDLAGGNKYICRCGQSAKFPYCDGSHNAFNAKFGTTFQPWVAARDDVGQDTIWVCGCGESKTRAPSGVRLCDGSHKSLSEEEKLRRTFVLTPALPASQVVAVPVASANHHHDHLDSWRLALLHWIQSRCAPFGVKCEHLTAVNAQVLLAIMKSLEPEAVREFNLGDANLDLQALLDVAETRMGIPKLFEARDHISEWSWSLYLSAYLTYLPRKFSHLRAAYDSAIAMLERVESAHQGVLRKIDDRKNALEDQLTVMTDRARVVAKKALKERKQYLGSHFGVHSFGSIGSSAKSLAVGAAAAAVAAALAHSSSSDSE